MRRAGSSPVTGRPSGAKQQIRGRDHNKGGQVDKLQFNFIATTHRGLEREAVGEVLALLKQIGDASPHVRTTDISGLIVGETLLDPLAVSRKLTQMVDDDPWSLRVLLRFIPVEKVMPAKLDELRSAAKEMAARIGPKESFRVTVEKRHTSLSSEEVVRAVASAVERKVNLERPDWLVLVEIIQSDAGLSVLRPVDIFSAVKVKRGESGLSRAAEG